MSQLPEDWEVVPLASVVQRPDYGFTASAQPIPVGPKFLRITDIQDGSVDWDAVPYCSIDDVSLSQKCLANGDVVVARIGATTGKAFLIDNAPDAVFASYMIRLRALPEKLLPAFLYYFMQTDAYWSHIEQNKGGRLKGGVNVPVLLSLSISHPKEVSEQHSIVDSIDLCRAGINIEREAEATAQELKQAAMRELFTRGLRGEAQKETEIGLVPKSWVTELLGVHHSVVSGGTPSRGNPEFWIDGTIPWVKTTEVDYCVIDETEERITRHGLENSAAKMLPTGTLLMAMYGQGVTRGKVAILGIEASCNQACAAIMPADDVIAPRYLYHFLSWRYEAVRSLAHGGQQQNLNLEIVRDLPVAYSQEKDEQDEIVAILDALDRKIALHRQKRAVLEDLFKSLLHKLMTGEIRVDQLDLSALSPRPAG